MPAPVDLSKLSDAVKNEYVVKKAEYDKLVGKVNNIDTSEFVLKTKYDTDKSELENIIPDTSGLVKKTDYNAKITETEGKILDVTNLATKTALTTVENKIPDVINLATKAALTTVDVTGLVKKTVYNTRATKIDAKVSSLAGAIAEYKTKNESIENRLKEATKNLLFIIWENTSFAVGDGSQVYLIFQPLHRYVKIINNTKYISELKSKGLPDESIKPSLTSDNGLTPLIDIMVTTSE